MKVIIPDFMALEPEDPKVQGYDAVFFVAGISSVGLKAFELSV